MKPPDRPSMFARINVCLFCDGLLVVMVVMVVMVVLRVVVNVCLFCDGLSC